MKDIIRHSAEFLRALRNKRFESRPDGSILLAAQGIVFKGFGGIRNITANEPWEEHQNVVTAQGIGVVLASGITGSSWYFAPYFAAVTPVGSITAANFNSTQTEFTNYDEATRQLCDYADPVAGVITNAAAVATITIAGGAQTAIYGFGIMSVSGKGSGAGACLAVSPLGSGRTGLQDGDEYGLKHTITGVSA